MWWEERYWLLLDVEWEAGRQKQGSPGYCCSVGGYQQLGSPLSSWHCNWAEGAMDGTTALPLRLSSSHPLPLPVPVVLSSSSASFLFFPPTQSFTFFQHQSPHLALPRLGFFYGFSLVTHPRWPPTLCSWMEISELHGSLRKDLFSSISTSTPTRLFPF